MMQNAALKKNKWDGCSRPQTEQKPRKKMSFGEGLARLPEARQRR